LTQLDAESYAEVIPGPYNASIGQHYRHVLDHFLCLEAGAPAGEINYDLRARDPRLETDLDFSRATTDRLMRVFENYASDGLSRPCKVSYSVGYGDAAPLSVTSTVERELAYCISHAVHHYAIIRLLCGRVGVNMLPEFGVAPSTLKHRAEQLAS
jgi:hypothetical protein